ncbi:LytTR family DNA-binding domain-containing protein [Flavobacterium sp.]|uniref:LytR/AlgR family response regulator transcription factor n=1 Tax=Flavobacterium sp. TaxID=239 RepID=UPI00260FBB32|nr:LytTR family DNA-binding domain-containing protein [Flavobacterium sp.]
MNCIIIDDDSTIRLQIREFCKLIGDINVLEEFSNPLEAFSFLKNHEIDLLFLDVNLPNLSGIDFINNYNINSKIIMITADASHAATVFGNNLIVDYITKPITLTRFVVAINKLNQKKKEEDKNNNETANEKSLFVTVDKKLIRIHYNEIDFVEANGDYVNFYLDKKTICVYSTLKKVKNKIQNHNFIQVHRSYIVNTNKIDEIEDTTIVIKNKTIPVSRIQRPVLLEKLNLL